MSKHYTYWLIIASLATLCLWLSPRPITYTAAATPKIAVSHAQEVWLGALEWCESRGKVQAVNPKDLDGTPSYGGFQFKPSTFDLFAKKYGVVGNLMDRDSQYEIVANMILDPEKIAFDKQFPDCVKKLGYPPRY